MQKGVFLRYLFLLGCFFIGANSLVLAQNSSNPFELKHRLSEDATQLPDSTLQEVSNQNPFDIKSTDSSELNPENTPLEPTEQKNPFDIKRKASNATKSSVKKKTVVPALEKISAGPKDTRSGFLFWSILSMMIYMALLVTLYRSLIGKIYRAFMNENILKLLQREQGAMVSIPYMFLYALFFINAGIFVFQVGYANQLISFEINPLLYCVLGVVIFFLLKHFLLKIIETVFPISQEIKQYSFTIIIFSIILGIILIPFNVFIAFGPESLIKSGIYATLVAIALIYLFRALRGMFIGSKFLAFHKFHFFMYICTVEIAPLLILIKLLSNGAIIQ